MKKTSRATASERNTPPAERVGQDESLTLSPSHAFVVQFRAESAIEHGRYVGRVEHVVSGQATTFHTLDQLLAFWARVLAWVRSQS